MQSNERLSSIVSLVAAGVLTAFCLSVGIKFVYRNVLPRPAAEPASADMAQTVSVDCAALYPFQDANDAPNATSAEEPPEVFSLPARYRARVLALKSVVEAYATDDIILHDEMTEAANAYDRLLGWNIRGVGEYNALVTLPDGYLCATFPAIDLSGAAADIVKFNDSCAQAGLPLLYVQAPFKLNARDTDYYGVVDFSNQNADALLARLRDAGISTLDLREAMEDAGIYGHAAFYKTDHHWLPETGFFAAGVVAERLNSELGFAIDLSLFDPDTVETVTYQDWFFGSQGKKATLACSAPENFTLLYPSSDMRYTLSVPSIGVKASGGFDTLYDLSQLGDRDYYNNNPYSTYFYGDAPLQSVHNESVGNGKRLLVLSDSFDNVCTPFLCQGIEYVDAIDLRYFTGSLQTYLAQNDYDAVLLLYSVDLYGYAEADPALHTSWHDYR